MRRLWSDEKERSSEPELNIASYNPEQKLLLFAGTKFDMLAGKACLMGSKSEVWFRCTYLVASWLFDGDCTNLARPRKGHMQILLGCSGSLLSFTDQVTLISLSFKFALVSTSIIPTKLLVNGHLQTPSSSASEAE
jgi:hypothetical protein